MYPLIFLPIGFGLFSYLLKDRRSWYLGHVLLLLEIVLATRLLLRVLAEGPILKVVGYHPTFVGISLKVNVAMASLALLGAVLWFFSRVYGEKVGRKDEKFEVFFNILRSAYYAFLFSYDLFNLFVLFELMSLSATVLIVYRKDGYALRSGLYYLMYNALAMIFFLMGAMILYYNVGSLNFADVVALADNRTLTFAKALIMGAFAVKSVFFPVTNWAHGAAPASIAMLLSGVIMKTGLIGFIKVLGVIEGPFFYTFGMVVGIVTLASGILFATSQRDIKMLLAFSTTAHTGYILIGVVAGGIAHTAGLLYIAHHALFKSLLFLTAGALAGAYGTRRIDEIKGVLATHPDMGIALVLGLLSMASFPLTGTYLVKSVILSGAHPAVRPLLHLAGALGLVYMLRLGSVLVGAKRRHTEKIPLHKRLAVYGLAALLLAGNLLQMVWTAPFGFKAFSVSLETALTFGAYLLVALAVYLVFVRREHKVLWRLRHFRLGFDRAAVLMTSLILFTLLLTR